MVDSLDQHDAVWTKLTGIPGLKTYDGEVADNPPVDRDGRVGAYAVLFFSPGELRASALDDRQTSLLGEFTVTCAGGDPTRVLWAVDRVRAGILGPVVINDRTYRIRVAENAARVVLRRDEQKKPPRHYVPLEFQLFTP